MRTTAAAVMLLFALAVAFLPRVAAPTPDTEPGLEPPPIAVCPLVGIADQHTGVSVLSSINGQGRVSAFAAGTETGDIEFSTGSSGSVTLNAAEFGAVGLSGGLVEMPSETTTAGVTVTGPVAYAAEGCSATPAAQTVIAGGTTVDAGFGVQLLNPYAGEATVDLVVATENGLEADARFQGVIVPPLSAVNLDMEAIIPGRERITAVVETTRGSVIATGRQVSEGRLAIWRAVEPAVDWWLPVPPGGEGRELIVTNPSAAEVEFQVDFYGPEGLVEAMESGLIAARQEVRVPLSAETSEAVAVRVIATEPVVATAWLHTPEALAATTGSPVEAATWLLPGARGPAGGSGTVVVLNSGLEPVTVSVRSLREESLIRSFEVAGGDILEEALVEADGYRVEATGPIVVSWMALAEGDGGLAIGHPLPDG